MQVRVQLWRPRFDKFTIAGGILLAGGAACVLYSVGVLANARVYQAAQLDYFMELPHAPAVTPVAGDVVRVPQARAPTLVELLIPPDPTIVGRLEISSIGLDAMVRDGVDADTLSKAVGRLPSSAEPGTPGNLVLMAHRDTFFRPLRKIAEGDVIRLRTRSAEYRYEVVSLTVTDPEKSLESEPVEQAWATLITCFPFDFTGPAPRRFLVRARQRD